MDTEQQKSLAAAEAAKLVQDGQIIGLGSGTTATYLLKALAKRVQSGLSFTGVPTSKEISLLATSLGLDIADLDSYPQLDLDIDGADEVDPNLNLIKGRGGAHLREKIVAVASHSMIVIADESKLVQRLGEHTPVPVEVVEFGLTVTRAALLRLGGSAELRGNDQPFRTDNGNLILDCRFPVDSHPHELASQIKDIPGVVEHGYFLGMASLAIIGRADGSVDRMRPAR